jgi:hypothetical protein
VPLHLHVDDVAGQEPAHQELEGEVVDALDVVAVVALLGEDPALDNAVAYGRGQRDVAVAVGGGEAVLGQAVAQVPVEILAQALGRQGHAVVGLLSAVRFFHAYRLTVKDEGASLPESPNAVTENTNR